MLRNELNLRRWHWQNDRCLPTRQVLLQSRQNRLLPGRYFTIYLLHFLRVGLLVMHGFQKFRHVVDVNCSDTSNSLVDLLTTPVADIDWHYKHRDDRGT